MTVNPVTITGARQVGTVTDSGYSINELLSGTYAAPSQNGAPNAPPLLFPSFTLSVRQFGALADGTDQTKQIMAAIAAMPPNGGTLYFPAGSYGISQPIKVPDNLRCFGDGNATIILPLSTWNYTLLGDYAMFINSNYPSAPQFSYTLNHGISFDSMCFDYTNLQNVPGGGTHAIRMQGVSRVSVTNCLFLYGNDGTAFITCNDTLVQGCFAYFIENAAYDHYAGPTNARVIGCSMQPAAGNVSAGGAFFNASDGSGTDTRTCANIVCSNNDFGGGISLDTLSSNCSCVSPIITGNNINCGAYGILGRGQIIQAIINDNQVSGQTATPPIWIDQGAAAGGGYTGNPGSTTVVGNQLENFTTSSGNQAALRLYGGGVVADNQVHGGNYPYALQLTGNTFYGTGNALAAGTSGTINGTLYAGTGALTLTNGGVGYAQADTGGSFPRWVVQNDNNVVMYGTNASGASTAIWTFPARSNAPILTINVPLGLSAPLEGTIFNTAYAGDAAAGAAGVLSGQMYINSNNSYAMTRKT